MTESPYHKGYLEGYLQQQTEQGGDRGRYASVSEATLAADNAVVGLSPEQESDYWLGYYHGRYHARTGNPAPVAVSPLPSGPVDSSRYLRTGADLVAARKQLGLSQGQLAVKLGTTVTTVSRWERGERWPRDIGTIALALERLGWQPGRE